MWKTNCTRKIVHKRKALCSEGGGEREMAMNGNERELYIQIKTHYP